MIEEVRKTGASIRLITDGDVAGVIFTAMQHETNIDIYLGIGGALTLVNDAAPNAAPAYAALGVTAHLYFTPA